MRIGFQAGAINERGMSVALYDYACGCQELLGHELTHVVQQSEGRVKPTTEVMGMPVNDDPSLEAEADKMGKKAAQTKRK